MFYCVTEKQRTSHERSDMFSALAYTLFASANKKVIVNISLSPQGQSL